MPEFPENCIYSGTDCWALMLKPQFDECPENVIGMISKFFSGTSKNLCNNEVYIKLPIPKYNVHTLFSKYFHTLGFVLKPKYFKKQRSSPSLLR